MNKVLNYLYKKKKVLAYMIFSVALILAFSYGLSHAYFEGVIDDPSEKSVNISSYTVDDIKFNVQNDISLPIVSQSNLGPNATDVISASTQATVTFKANNYRDSSSSYSFYMMANSPFVYSDTFRNQAEVLMIIKYNGTTITPKNKSTYNIDLSNLEYRVVYTSVNTIESGWDITNARYIPIVIDKAISATKAQTVVDTYEVSIVFAQLYDNLQIANFNKRYTATLKMQKDVPDYCEATPSAFPCQYNMAYNPTNDANIALDHGTIYYHATSLTNGASDNSFRFAGDNPNNYVCFGSTAQSCSASNLYRIIGLMPVDVVVDDSDPTDIQTETQTLYKIVKNDYLTASELGLTSAANATLASSYDGPDGNQPLSAVDGFYWSGDDTNQSNTWSTSTLNTTGLNGTYLTTTLGNTWSNKIANVMWKVGGNTATNITSATPMSTVYTNEITTPSATNTTDTKTEIASKIGMLYATDYSYAAPQASWSSALSAYDTATIIADNWLYRGVDEWLLTRSDDNADFAYAITNGGSVSSNHVSVDTNLSYDNSFAVRPVFYLTSDTTIDISGHAGTAADPYRIN